VDFKQASTCRDKGVCSNDFVFIKKIELVFAKSKTSDIPVKEFLATMQVIFWQTNTNNQSETTTKTAKNQFEQANHERLDFQ